MVGVGREQLELERPAWSKEATELLDRAVERLPLSGRGRAQGAARCRDDRGARGRAGPSERITSRKRCPTGPRPSWARHERARAGRLRRGEECATSSTRRAIARTSGSPRTFDAPAYLRRLEESGVTWLARSDPQFPPLLAAIHDPPPGLFLRGAVGDSALRRTDGGGRRRPSVLAVRRPGRPHART